jgi:ring-1,2-phenylacetyl-CoA epoxidase subunit PaaD
MVHTNISTGNEQIRNILSEVTDPEIPVLTIGDMGIIRDIQTDVSGLIRIVITPTYTGCPAMDMITVNIKSALQEHGYDHVEVQTVLYPEWTTDWITAEGKAKLKAYGIAPPAQKTTDTAFIKGENPIVHCPLCDSPDTEMISRFGSTPCKSLYKCNACLEPFDYFKCH